MTPDYFRLYLPLQIREQAPCVVEVITTHGERYAIRGIDTILDGAVLLEVYPRENCRHSRDVMTEKLTRPYRSISAVRVIKNAAAEAEVIRMVRPAAPD